jgi:hypothetical protein
MADRTAELTITFRRSFKLGSLPDVQPAGNYRLVTDEEEILGLSFLAYRRTATMLHTPAIGSPGGEFQVHLVNPAELDAAMKADSAAA